MGEIAFISQKELDRVKRELPDKFERLQLIGDMCRLNAISAIKFAGSGHLGSSLSAMDVVVLLYLSEMDLDRIRRRDPNRDIFFSSKGHDAPGQYAAMVAAGIIDFDMLLRLRRLDGLDGHPDIRIAGVEANTGSLGMGISKAKGMALAKKLNGWAGRIFVMTGDGEFQEGQIWESLQTTAHQKIANITVIVDANEVQSDKRVQEIIDLGDLKGKVAAFGWHVDECNGHNIEELSRKLTEFQGITDKPKVLIARTVKGKGVSFMEHPYALEQTDGIYRWHSGAPDDESYEAAKTEITARVNARLRQLGVKEITLEAVEPLPSKPSKKGVGETIVSAYGEALVRLGTRRSDIVVLDGDLAADCGLVPFQRAFPERFVENGIAEQDMVSTAGGLALQGLLPVVNSFGVFLAARANEQIYNNATEETKIIYVCHYAGLLPAGPGKSHQSLRDISLVGALPTCITLEPCNGTEAQRAIEWCVDVAEDTCLLRLSLFPPPGQIILPQDYQLSLGRGVVLREGTDAVIFGYGPVMLHEALAAAEELSKDGCSLKVVNMPWLNRVDRGWFENVVGDCRAVFALDNHAPVGGLGDCLLNSLAQSEVLPKKRFRKFAVEGYPACGSPSEVLQYHGLDRKSLASRIRRELDAIVGASSNSNGN